MKPWYSVQSAKSDASWLLWLPDCNSPWLPVRLAILFGSIESTERSTRIILRAAQIEGARRAKRGRIYVGKDLVALASRVGLPASFAAARVIVNHACHSRLSQRQW